MKKITIRYQCNACVSPNLVPMGFSCKFSYDTLPDAQGFCISKCPIFGDKQKADWKFISEGGQ